MEDVGNIRDGGRGGKGNGGNGNWGGGLIVRKKALSGIQRSWKSLLIST